MFVASFLVVSDGIDLFIEQELQYVLWHRIIRPLLLSIRVMCPFQTIIVK